jgi:hypothetical protein
MRLSRASTPRDVHHPACALLENPPPHRRPERMVVSVRLLPVAAREDSILRKFGRGGAFLE